MIELIADKTARLIKKANPEETSSIEVMRFGLIMVYGTTLTILLSIPISITLGTLSKTVYVLAAFAFLRFFSGGFHFSNAELCSISSAIGSVCIPFFQISDELSFSLIILSAVLMVVLAPRGINQSKIFKQEHYPLLKIVSVSIVLTNLLIFSDLLTITFFIQSLTLLLVKGGEQHADT